MNRIDALFETLIQEGGSDLHLLESQPPKIRKHGEIRPIREAALDHEEMIALLQPLASPAAWQKFVEHGDLDFAYEMSEEARFRCNYYKQLHGYGAIFRIIPTRIKTIA